MPNHDAPLHDLRMMLCKCKAMLPQAAISLGMSAFWVIGRIPIFQRAYSEHMRKREDDAWLRNQCKVLNLDASVEHADPRCDKVHLLNLDATS